ncbi:MAG: F0F1 ATP synthase subunit A [Candidatus Coatesbacteria bacterium]
MSGEGGLPHSLHILPPLHIPAMPGAPEVDSYAASFWFLTAGIILGLSLLMRVMMAVSPGVIQNLIEWLVETVQELADSILGPAAERFMPLFIALFLFILTGNLLGLLPGCMSPTASYHTNAAMAIVVALATQYAGIRAHGLKGYLRHFMPPPCPWWLMYSLMWWMWPLIHVLEQFIRPISLTMRLFGNIFAKEILLLMLAFVAATFMLSPSAVIKGFSVLPFILRPAIILLGTLVSIVQAAVFTILTMVFVAMAMEGHEEGHGEAVAREESGSGITHS